MYCETCGLDLPCPCTISTVGSYVEALEPYVESEQPREVLVALHRTQYPDGWLKRRARLTSDLFQAENMGVRGDAHYDSLRVELAGMDAKEATFPVVAITETRTAVEVEW